MILKKAGNMISSITKKSKLFVLNTQSYDNKIILIKKKRRPIYLCSKNPQIKLWHRQLGYISNARVIKKSKLTDNIDITINEDQ